MRIAINIGHELISTYILLDAQELTELIARLNIALSESEVGRHDPDVSNQVERIAGNVFSNRAAVSLDDELLSLFGKHEVDEKLRRVGVGGEFIDAHQPCGRNHRIERQHFNGTTFTLGLDGVLQEVVDE